MKETVFLTGAGSGIGKAIAKKLSADGYDLVLIGRRLNKLQETATEINRPSECLELDLSLGSQIVTDTVKSWIQDHSENQVIGLVNNAGQFLRSPFGDDQDDWDLLFQVNLMGPVNLTRALWPHFQKNREGRIVNISSNLGQTPVAGTSAYSALKAALDNFTKCLALEGGAFNIRVNSVAPGLVDTPIHDFHQKDDSGSLQLKAALHGMHPLSRMGQAEDIAGAVSYFLNPNNSWTTGAILNVDGGLSLTSKDP